MFYFLKKLLISKVENCLKYIFKCPILQYLVFSFYSCVYTHDLLWFPINSINFLNNHLQTFKCPILEFSHFQMSHFNFQITLLYYIYLLFKIH